MSLETAAAQFSENVANVGSARTTGGALPDAMEADLNV